MPNMGLPPTGAAADHTSYGPPDAGSLTHQEPAGGSVQPVLGQA
jgi:hypothetical protein